LQILQEALGTICTVNLNRFTGLPATGCPTPAEEHFVTPGVAPDRYLGTRKFIAQLELSLKGPPPTSGHLPQIHLQTGFSIPEFANVDLGEEELKMVAQLELSLADAGCSPRYEYAWS